MAWIRAMGKPKKPGVYLYDNGNFNVLFDNGVYNPWSTAFNKIPWVFSAATITGVAPGRSNVYSMNTNATIDFSLYQTLNFKLDDDSVVTMDVSAITSNLYLMIQYVRTNVDDYIWQAWLITTKRDAAYEVKIADINIKPQTNVGYTATIKEIWLE